MPHPFLLYYITDRSQFPGTEAGRRSQLLKKIKEAAIAGVDYIQLREKDLCARDLETLAGEAIIAVSNNSPSNRSSTRILINSRTDVALAVGADGVHLRANDITPSEARQIWASAQNVSSERPGPLPAIAVSCHTPDDVRAAQQNGADFTVFAPVFEKKDSPAVRPAGLEALGRACQHKIPVLALGGVTLDNAPACLEAGAAGIAAIRLFQENEMNEVVERLRGRLT